ncbi:MAG: exosortase/archaeosortase family protein [Verrucomicrobia bacterium]|nr:exosortase/archaeosortase family protein [Verrucomicrobiota bacterium]
MDDAPQSRTRLSGPFLGELGRCWREMPDKPLAAVLLAAWVALFHFFGNSTLGYTPTHSLFGWMEYAYRMSADDAHGRLIPWVVLGICWWKRDVLLAVPKAPWWPGVGLLAAALALHFVGYVVQQARISIVAFFLGVYALTGIAWGPRWLKASFFPFCLLAFCVPLGTMTETITFPLRMIATQITAVLSRVGLGIDVIQDGTRIFDPNGAYQYEVAAACSGIRSLTVTLALAVIYAFVYFQTWWRRALIIAAAAPVAVAANVMRLTSIILAAETFGAAAGNYVHQSAWMSLMPYIPALLGIVVLGWWMREARPQSLPSRLPTPP